MLLCTRAELDRRSGDSAAARARLAEVEAIMAAVAAGPGSELGRRLASVRAELERG